MRRWSVLLWMLLLLYPATAQSPEQLVEQAKALEQAGKPAEAARLWEQAAEALSHPDLASYQARSYLYAAFNHCDVGDFKAALPNVTRAVELFEALADDEGLALSSLQKGVVESELARWSQAESSLRVAAETARKTGNQARLLEASDWLGKVLEAQRRWPEATEAREGLLAACRKGDPTRVPHLLTTLGALYSLQNQLAKSEDAYREAIALLHEQPEKHRQARKSLARMLLQNHQSEKALELLEGLLQGDPGDLGAAVDRAYALEELGRHKEALQALEGLLPRADAALKPVIKVRRVQVLAALGKEQEALASVKAPDFGSDDQRAEAAELLGQYDLCQTYLTRALAAAASSDKPSRANALAVRLIRWGKPAQAATLLEGTLRTLPAADPLRPILVCNLGEAYLSQGQPSQAIPLFQKALELSRSEEGELDKSALLSNLGAAYQYLGEYRQALAYLEQALDLTRAQADENRSGSIYNAMGVLYVKMGRPEDGIAFYQRALANHRSHLNRVGETTSLINLGAAYEVLEQPEKSQGFYLQALDVAEKNGLLPQQLVLLNNLGQLSDDMEKAAAYYQQALRLEKSAPDVLTRHIIGSNLADSYRRLGRSEDALALAEQSCAALRELGAKENELAARRVLMLLALARDDSAATGQELERALDLARDVVTGLSSASARGFVHEHEPWLRAGLGPVLSRGEVEQAFSADERLRSLGLAALTNGLPLDSAHLPSELVEREKTLLNRMREASLRSADLSALYKEHRLLRDRMERHHLAAGALRSLEPAGLSEVRSLLQADEAMLEYVLAGDHLWLLVITGQDARAVRLGAVATLEPQVAAAFRRVSSPSRIAETNTVLDTLSATLWQPALPFLAGKRRLVIIPAGPLYPVPFAALREDGKPLVERYALSQATSASAWLLSRRSPSVGQGALVAALGNQVPSWSESPVGMAPALRESLTPLPATLLEAANVAASLKTEDVLQEKQLTGDALRFGSVGRRALHFATHGLMNADDPMQSGLVACDRLVTAQEIFGWKLDAELAVLSACHSGRLSDGLEYVSLTRAFQFAGARTLLATGWAVSDDATAVWMEAFYKSMAAGKAADEAAQEAYLALREGFPHPYYWAPFALWGDGTVHP